MNSVYKINKGINKPIEFKGIKAQYIAYMAVGLVSLLLLFAIMYLCGVHLYICLAIVGTLGTVLFTKVSGYSRRYGRYGLMKKLALKKVPACLKVRSRNVFRSLTQTEK